METAAVVRRRNITSLTLSDLPENLIHEILSRLPIKDAGRTSTLSRSWRCRWQSIPNFDLSAFNPSHIYQLLHLHSGSIRLFKAQELESPEYVHTDLNEWSSSDVKRWLSILSLHSASTLRTLTLSSSSSCYCTYNASHIARSFPNLTHLHLSCSLNRSRGYSFSALKDLHLDLHDTNYEVPSLIVSSSPVLESLDIHFTYSYKRTPGALDIVAPNLRRLKLSQIVLSEFAVTSAPLLETVSFKLCGRDGQVNDDGDGVSDGLEDCILMKVLGGMTSIKELELDAQFLMFLGSALAEDTIPISFRNLMVVSLGVDFDDVDAVYGVLWLLRSIPHLQELNIRAYGSFEDDSEVVEAADDLWVEHEFAGLFNNLETVKLTEIAYKQVEIGFIRFLFSKAHILKTVTISFDQQVDEPIMTELLKLPKASSQAQILLISADERLE